MGAVFVNYRRGDSEGQARSLALVLTSVLGANAVFIDVDDLALGRDFRQALNERLADCDFMFVLIGKGWLDAKDDAGKRRLEDPADYVRQEIAAGLRRNIVVTPVLLQGTSMPPADQLPDDIKELSYRGAFGIRHQNWESDVKEMLRRLGVAKSYRHYWVAAAAAVLVVALAAFGVYNIGGPAEGTGPAANSPDQTPAVSSPVTSDTIEARPREDVADRQPTAPRPTDAPPQPPPIGQSDQDIPDITGRRVTCSGTTSTTRTSLNSAQIREADTKCQGVTSVNHRGPKAPTIWSDGSLAFNTGVLVGNYEVWCSCAFTDQ